MNPLIDPLQDKSFADELRKSDRSVSVKPAELTNRLMAGRRRKRKNQFALAIAIPVGLVLIGFATKWVMTLPWPYSVSESIAQANLDEPEEVESEFRESSLVSLADSLRNRDVLDAKQEKLRELQKEIELLKKAKSHQDWALSRELVSRTEIDQAIGKYKF